MALLNFNYGLVKDLPAERINGNLYITTDSQGLYVDLEGVRTHVSDFIQVESQAALEALGTYYPQVFYYVSGSNALLKYTGSGWKQLNSTSDLQKALNDLTARVAANEGNITTLNTELNLLETRVDGLNATNINTTEKFTVTTAVGNYKAGDEIAADDLQTILINMLCKDSNPTKTDPSISITLTGAGALEVGTTFTPSYTINTSAGKYTANGKTQASGVTFNNYKGVEVNRPDAAIEATLEAKTGSFGAFIVTDDVDYYVQGSASHSDGVMPTTYLGKDYPSVQIKAKDLDAVDSTHVTGYRPIFTGMSTSTAALDSTAIRGLTKQESKPAATTITFKAANKPGVKRFIVAIPASSTLTLKKAIITSSQNADATADYVKQSSTVAVQGASGYATTKPYNVWIYEPASIADVEVHEVTIG